MKNKVKTETERGNEEERYKKERNCMQKRQEKKQNNETRKSIENVGKVKGNKY